MVDDGIRALPRRPESVVEWEELLIRLEIVPRVVRSTVEEVVDPGVAVELLVHAGERERQIGRWLEAAAGLDGAGGARGPSGRDVRSLGLHFASLRARTFAMVQRRGLDVWEWEGPLGGEGSVTVHQLLCWLAEQDAALLSGLRRAAGAGSVEC